MKIIKRNFDRSYHDNPIYREYANSQRNQARLALLQTYRNSGRLLEIGCGMGGFLRLAEDSFEVEGIDISRFAIQALHPHFGERVSVLNVEQRPLPRSRYDVIVVFNILEHLRQPNKVADKLAAALTEGGLLLGSVPNKQSGVGEVVTRVGNFFDRTHVSTFHPSVWERIFRHAGFRQTDFFGELNLGRNHCRYLRSKAWPHLSFNLMFACQK